MPTEGADPGATVRACSTGGADLGVAVGQVVQHHPLFRTSAEYHFANGTKCRRSSPWSSRSSQPIPFPSTPSPQQSLHLHSLASRRRRVSIPTEHRFFSLFFESRCHVLCSMENNCWPKCVFVISHYILCLHLLAMKLSSPSQHDRPTDHSSSRPHPLLCCYSLAYYPYWVQYTISDS
jgi:hypothetical protein